VRSGVQAGSYFHLTEFFGPVLGVMTAATLDEAIALQNQVEYGLTSGLHSLNPAEMKKWLGGIHAGNLYINRGITGAIVQRQPFGGWKKSAVGTGTKAGGPNYLTGLGSWQTRPSACEPVMTDARISRLIEAVRDAITPAEQAFLQRSFASDAAAWDDEFGVSRDVSGLGAERNIFRYLARPVTVRLAEGESLAALVRVVAAGRLTGAQLEVSTAINVPDALRAELAMSFIPLQVESDERFLAGLEGRGALRIRLIGGDPTAVAHAVKGRPDVAVHANAVTEAGRLELLPFLLEQAVSITAHRFGTPNHLSDAVI
jgi:RHH-type proline utilization regulon transcriptional repressor/proline dehydrogenase/delta 1-pyrroline-5-carboxylate dehydrogenase